MAPARATSPPSRPTSPPPTGRGVWASLAKHRAIGDGHDKLFGFESIEGSAFRDTLIGNGQGNVIDGGPGDDHLIGGGGPDTLDGGQGSDGCKGAKGGTISCGKEKAPKGSAYVELDPPRQWRRRPADRRRRWQRQLHRLLRRNLQHLHGHRDQAAGRRQRLHLPAAGRQTGLLPGRRAGPLADGRPRPGQRQAAGRRLAARGRQLRFAGGRGDDEIHAGPEDDLIEAGPGADKLYGGAGADGLVGGLPGPTFLYGEGNGDLLAAGGGCAGGALVGGPGRDDASFAETQAHPGLLYISFPKHAAWIDAIKGCHKVHLSPTDEDMEGSFDWDVLIGDSRANSMLGQPGKDVFIGNGGDDVIDARDGERDFSIQCGRGTPPHKKPHGKGMTKGTGKPAGRALTDSFDPQPVQLRRPSSTAPRCPASTANEARPAGRRR